MDFSQTTSNPPVTVDLLQGTSSPGSILGFANGDPDTITGLTTVTGSPNGGNVFEAGPGPAQYNFTAGGNGNTFTGGPGTDTFNGSGSDNLITVGTGNATFADTGGSGNEMDFSQLPSLNDRVTVNVSGSQDGSTQNDQATAALGGVYTFGPSATVFNGAPSGSTFEAGAGGPGTPSTVLVGAANTLSFGNVQSATVGLKVCVVDGAAARPSRRARTSGRRCWVRCPMRSLT